MNNPERDYLPKQLSSGFSREEGFERKLAIPCLLDKGYTSNINIEPEISYRPASISSVIASRVLIEQPNPLQFRATSIY
jgi:hypothetical protein